MNNFPYRPNVAMLVYHASSLLLWIGERRGEPGHWQFPQGGVDAGTTLEDNVIRELVEELGASATHFGAPTKLAATHRYDFQKPREYGGIVFRGQDQTFWAVPFLGSDADFDLTAHEPEFQRFRWVTPAQVRDVAAAHRLAGYERALVDFEALLLYLKGAGDR